MQVGSLFTGLGGADIGISQAFPDAEHVFGCEIDEAAQKLYAARFPQARVLGDICGQNFSTLNGVDILWGSPPCVNFSMAKRNGGETKADFELATSICAAIRQLQPKYFFLENVSGYVKSSSFSLIVDVLFGEKYSVSWRTYSMSQHGFFQHRDRLILRARQNDQILEVIDPDVRMEMSTADFFPGTEVAPRICNTWHDVIGATDRWQPTNFTQKQRQSIAQYSHDLQGTPFLIERFGYSNRLPIIRRADQPWVTVRAAHGHDGKGSFRSPFTYVNEVGNIFAIDLAGLALLQGFSLSDFDLWHGLVKDKVVSSGVLGKAIGNAVPPPFVKFILQQTVD